ncbi:hypothetical protein Tco_0927129 [Tanacetum coccineum]|uniref:Uncharacterized protein n=1 Tax=Tanacetum coccineum TaxID=301880 RepID=A0ABQ5DBR6_9ASTR
MSSKLRRNFCHGRKNWEKMGVLLLHLIFTLPGELRTSPRVPAYFDNRNTALLQTLDLTVHDLDRLFDKVQFVIDLDFISHALLQIRNVKRTMNSTQLLWEFKSVGDDSYFGNDLKRSYIARVQCHTSPRRKHKA